MQRTSFVAYCLLRQILRLKKSLLTSAASEVGKKLAMEDVEITENPLRLGKKQNETKFKKL